MTQIPNDPMTTAHSLQIRTLAGRDVIAQGNCCDLRLEEADGTRHWLCRSPVGKTDHRIIVETYDAMTNTYAVTAVYTDEDPQ